MSDQRQKTIGEMEEYVRGALESAREHLKDDPNLLVSLGQAEAAWSVLRDQFIVLSVELGALNNLEPEQIKEVITVWRARMITARLVNEAVEKEGGLKPFSYKSPYDC